MKHEVPQQEKVSQQSEALLIMAMLLQDEDGVNYIHPQAISRRIAILRLTEKRLRRCYDAVPRLVNRLSSLVDQLIVTSNRYETLIQQHKELTTGDSEADTLQAKVEQKIQELADERDQHRQKETTLRQDFIRMLKTECLALRNEISAIHPIASTCIVQDIIIHLENNADETGNAQTFRKVVKRLTRKFQSIQTILSNPLLAAFEAQLDNRQKIAIISTMNLNGITAFNQVSGSHAPFTGWAVQRGIPYEKAKNFWEDAATIIWEKLHWGDFDHQYDDSLTRLIAKIAHNKVKQHYRDLYRSKNAQLNPGNALFFNKATQTDDQDDDDEEDSFLEFEARRVEEYKFCAFKLGFDFIDNDDYQKSILYFGSVVKSHYFVWDDERREVESELQIQLDSITQEAISELLNLGISQTAVAHRLSGYRRRWYSYTRSVLLQLRSQAYTTEKTDLIDFFQKILFWTMTKLSAAPTGTETWYADYTRMRRETLQSQ